MTSANMKVDGMTCQGCVRSVEKKLLGVPGVIGVMVDLPGGKATVQYDESRAQVEEMVAAVKQIGFEASPLT